MKLEEALVKVQAQLGPHLLNKKYAAMRPIDAPRSWGCCYVACEALAHAVNPHRYRPASIRINKDIVHWYLVDTSLGDIVDPTADQFEGPIDYTLGQRRGFLTVKPSKRAQMILDLVLDKS